MLTLQQIKRTDPRLLKNMLQHYSQPKGFVGRNICYAVLFNNTYYGAIVGGSATRFLPGRNEFLGKNLNQIVNNIFFHLEKQNGKYPIHEMLPTVLKLFRERVSIDWKIKYGDDVIGFESLVELPRTGECYKRDGWKEVGITKGYTCKRVAGKGTDSWSGKRVWNVTDLRPKRVFCKLNESKDFVAAKSGSTDSIPSIDS